jgi:phi13 family phage major tail protein
MKKNKVRFGLNKLYWAKIVKYDDTTGLPIYGDPIRFPGAVSLSLDVSGENANFYADNGIYYVLSNTSGYDGDLEVALITEDFEKEILGCTTDEYGNMVETNTAEVSEFALLFEFDGDKNHIRHCLFKCTASRSGLEGSTTEDEKEVQTETLSLSVGVLDNGVVKKKTCSTTTIEQYNNWYKRIEIPTIEVTESSTDVDYSISHSPLTTVFTDSAKITLTSAAVDENKGVIKYRLNYSGDYQTYTAPIEITESTTVEAFVSMYTSGSAGSYSAYPTVITYTKS